MDICHVVEWSPKETNMGYCGRTLANGACPMHGHTLTAPVSSMVFPIPKSERLASRMTNEEPKQPPSGWKMLVIRLGQASMLLGLLLPSLSVKMFAVGLVLFLGGFQVWITAKCWMK